MAGGPTLRPSTVIALVTLAVALVTAGFVVLGLLVGESFGYFSKEPAETFNVPRYIGWQAYTIWMIEAVGAAVALFSGWVVRRHRGPGREASFLLAAGAFTVILLTDDMYQFHDYVYVRLFRLDERVVYAAYGLLALGIAWRWGRYVIREAVSVVLASGLCMALSVATDTFLHKGWTVLGIDAFHTTEDGLKMLGLTLWAAFLVRISSHSVSARLAAAPRPAPLSDRDPADTLVLPAVVVGSDPGQVLEPVRR